jgi:hypothetical protein
MFLGRSRGILTIISALFIHIADTMLYVNLVDNSASSLGSYPVHERDSAAEAQRLIKGAAVRTQPPSRLCDSRYESFLTPWHKVNIICLVVLFIAPVCAMFLFFKGGPLL